MIDLILLNLEKRMNRSREEWFQAMLQMSETEWEKSVDSLLKSDVVLPQVPVAQVRSAPREGAEENPICLD